MSYWKLSVSVRTLLSHYVSDEDLKNLSTDETLMYPFKYDQKDGKPHAIIPPSSKFIFKYALILAGLGKCQCKIKNLFHSGDTIHMLNAANKLNDAKISWKYNGEIVVVQGQSNETLTACKEDLYLGNAGTMSRFLTSLDALVQSSNDQNYIISTGNARMQ